MPDQITTAAELDALPNGSVVLDRYDAGWQKCDDAVAWPSGRLIKRGPLTILWRPDVPPVIPGQNPRKPTKDDVARVLAAEVAARGYRERAERAAAATYPESDITYGYQAVREAYEYGYAAGRIQELRDAAAGFDREMAVSRARQRVAVVRCTRCGLFHGGREQYSCLIEGTAHDYDAAELAEAAQLDGETSWIGDRLRARAAAIESGAEHG